MKKLLCSMLVMASLSGVSGAALAAEPSEVIPSEIDYSKETATLNTEVSSKNASLSPLAAYVHTSERVIANDGTSGYTHAWTYSGGTAYYMKASIKATYSNGMVNGASGSNPNTSNLSEAYSLRIYEDGPKRQYHSSSECRNTSSSALEGLSGSSKIFD